MKIGDRVKHQSGAFDFTGTLLGCVVTRNGARNWVVEQEGTNYVQLFGEWSLNLLETKLTVNAVPGMVEYFDALPPPPPPPPPPPEFPIKLWVPIKAVPGQSPQRNRFNAEVRTFLPLKPLASLVVEDVKCEIVFHFPRSETGDIDNLTKSVLDSLKGSVIYDDKQVKELHAKYAANSRTGFDVILTKYAP